MHKVTFEDTIATYDKTAKDYIKKSGDVGGFKCPELDKFIALLPPKGRVLDAGCGAGHHVRRFEKVGITTVGVDISSGVLEQAHKIYPKYDLRQMDLRKLDFPSNSFEGVWSWAALLHMDKNDVETCFNEFHRILKTEGKLAILLQEGTGKLIKYDTVRFVLYKKRK
jgi:ubiquinone/menaquinone biosynthesis C-methylase UbiE